MFIVTSRPSVPVILTGPFPAYLGRSNPSATRRREAMTDAGWIPGRGVRYVWPTASAAWDGAAKRIWIGADDDIDPCDWREVLGVLRMTGWLTGRKGYTDIGEPGWDRANRVWLWNLSCP